MRAGSLRHVSQLGLTIAFSAFIGMIAMALLFPVPGYVASMIQGVQTEKMKKVRTLVPSNTHLVSDVPSSDGCPCAKRD